MSPARCSCWATDCKARLRALQAARNAAAEASHTFYGSYSSAIYPHGCIMWSLNHENPSPALPHVLFWNDCHGGTVDFLAKLLCRVPSGAGAKGAGIVTLEEIFGSSL